MNLLCALGRHRPPHPYFAAHRNGVWYGECPLCLTEIIKVGRRRWKPIPKNCKIVYETSREGGSIHTVPSLKPRT